MRFVVQQHSATAMHWDFRLEAEDGTLKSWAVPRGPSLDPGTKRLAMRTGDHAMEHADFEGVIGDAGSRPGDGDGAGPVIIWDEGEFDNTSYDHGTGRRSAPLDVVTAVEAGHVSVVLHGHKLTGGFALTRTGREPRERWVLVKKKDGDADPAADVVTTRPESVRSGLRIDEVRRP